MLKDEQANIHLFFWSNTFKHIHKVISMIDMIILREQVKL